MSESSNEARWKDFMPDDPSNIKLSTRADSDLLHLVKWILAGSNRQWPEFVNEAFARQIAYEEHQERTWVDPIDKKSAKVLMPGEPYPDPPGRKIRLKAGRPSEGF